MADKKFLLAYWQYFFGNISSHLASEETKLFERGGVNIQRVELDIDKGLLVGGTHLISNCMGHVFVESSPVRNRLVRTRDTKSQNFPVGKNSSAKTFRTKCGNRFRDIYEPKSVNRFCDIYVPKVRKSLSRHTCQNAKTLLTKV